MLIIMTEKLFLRIPRVAAKVERFYTNIVEGKAQFHGDIHLRSIIQFYNVENTQNKYTNTYRIVYIASGNEDSPLQKSVPLIFVYNYE